MATLSLDESTESMWIKCLRSHNILVQPEFEPSIAASRNRHLNHMINMHYSFYYYIIIIITFIDIITIVIIIIAIGIINVIIPHPYIDM